MKLMAGTQVTNGKAFEYALAEASVCLLYQHGCLSVAGAEGISFMISEAAKKSAG